jgi:hypothetical protein
VGHWLDALAKASTGNRARHRSLSSDAESPPEAERPVEISVAPKAQGLTRRALIRRGAVVGAVVWTTPILQTALAPAASASVVPPCTVSCPVGTPCASTANCASGLICSGGVCKIPYGGSGTCASGADCQSGNCNPTTQTCIASWPGTSCTAGSQCLSGKCNGGTCFANPVGGYCRTTADCTDNTTCPASGNGLRVCGGPGASCQNNNKCVSHQCNRGVCT